MSEEEFRIKHSKIIEQYQLIEYHLEGLFGILQYGNFEELTHRVENDTMGELIRKIRFIIKEGKYTDLDKNDFNDLEDIRNDRNYWCHQCFIDIKRLGNDAIKVYQRIDTNLQAVIKMNEKLEITFKKHI